MSFDFRINFLKTLVQLSSIIKLRIIFFGPIHSKFGQLLLYPTIDGVFYMRTDTQTHTKKPVNLAHKENDH